MKVKSVVKVMNFHSLLRVDSSRRRAEKFFEYEKELTNFVDNILNNKNLILDKKVLKLNPSKKALNIYIANDLGFCGNFNSNVNFELKNDKECDKIIIGKKIMKNSDQNVILETTKEEFKDNINKIEEILLDGIINKKYSEVNLIYNHYYNISKIELVKKKLLPLEKDMLQKKEDKYKEDFVVEGNINDILANIIVLYLLYEIKIATENSYASENIERQMLTKKSLKKIEEIEEEEQKEERKERKMKSFRKLLDSIIKTNKVES